MTQASKLPWHSEFVDMGGYDCMTDAQRIYSGNQHVATIDYSDFGQEWCQPFSDDTKAKADANAALIVEAVNSHAALVERVAKLEAALIKVCKAIDEYAPMENAALNEAWIEGLAAVTK